MDEVNVNEVIAKWQSQSLTTNLENDEWYKQPTNEVIPNRRVRRKLDKRTVQNNVANEITLSQKRFQLQPPQLQSNDQRYEIYSCKHCKNSLKYFNAISKDLKSYSKTIDLMTCVAPKLKKNNRSGIHHVVLPLSTDSTLQNYILAHVSNDESYKTVISTNFASFIYKFGMRCLKKCFNNICFQSKDRKCIEEMAQMKVPIFYLYEHESFIKLIIIYFTMLSFSNKVPYAIINGEAFTSSVIRWILRKIGFLLLENNIEKSEQTRIAEDLLKILHQNGSIIASIPINCCLTSSYACIIKDVLKEIKSDKSDSYVVPVNIAVEDIIEKQSSKHKSGSLFSYFTQYLYQKTHLGLIQINISKPVLLESLRKVTNEMCPPTEDEEFNLILRHIRHEIFLSSTILPVHIVSFLLLYRFQHGVLYNELLDAFDLLFMNLKDENRFFGFAGESDAVLSHSLTLLQHQNLIRRADSNIVPLIDLKENVQKFYNHSIQIIQTLMSKSIIASSIILCVGGTHKLLQGTGENIPCSKNEIIDAIKDLAEMMSYMLDFCCPYTEIETALDDILATMPMVTTEEEYYEDQRHLKLVQSVQMTSGWSDEDDEFGQYKKSNINYKISVDHASIATLTFLHSIVQPYVQLYFNVGLLLNEKKQDAVLSIESILQDMEVRYDNKVFCHGEMLTLDHISRVFDFLYEKEMIDENDDMDGFLFSRNFKNDEGMAVIFLNDISKYL